MAWRTLNHNGVEFKVDEKNHVVWSNNWEGINCHEVNSPFKAVYVEYGNGVNDYTLFIG